MTELKVGDSIFTKSVQGDAINGTISRINTNTVIVCGTEDNYVVKIATLKDSGYFVELPMKTKF